jgi:type VI secretion system secreted protein VgrG
MAENDEPGMTQFVQDGRLLTLATPLGGDTILAASLRGVEELSCLFAFELDLLAPNDTNIPFERILGQTLTATLRQADGEERHFNGLVSRFTQCGRDQDLVQYRALVVPHAWTLTLTRRCRIFQNMSTPDILREVLSDCHTSFKLRGTYPRRTYCVQYEETDFAFVSRLMEDDGIAYTFVHEPGRHQMLLTDSSSVLPRLAGDRDVVIAAHVGQAGGNWQVSNWEKTQELRSARCTVRDHSFKTPRDTLEGSVSVLEQVKAGSAVHKPVVPIVGKSELYDYPGGYAKRHEALAVGQDPGARVHQDRDWSARLRVEAEECRVLSITGRSNCGAFAAGSQFRLRSADDSAGSYILTRVEHEIWNGGWRSSDAAVASYRNTFRCLPADLTWRPARTTPRPVIVGVQTATVTGPAGEDLFCDRYGRIKVQFHWDREGRRDANSSCWLRVAQIWAGHGWGAFFWPRIGHEVVVAFEDGDPDRPLVVGSVYNAENLPPYQLPAGAHLGGIRSASVRGGSRPNFNSVVFNDTKGGEHLAIHSEHNLSLNSEYDRMIHSGRHKGERVANSSMLAIGCLPGD